MKRRTFLSALLALPVIGPLATTLAQRVGLATGDPISPTLLSPARSRKIIVSFSQPRSPNPLVTYRLKRRREDGTWETIEHGNAGSSSSYAVINLKSLEGSSIRWNR